MSRPDGGASVSSSRASARMSAWDAMSNGGRRSRGPLVSTLSRFAGEGKVRVVLTSTSPPCYCRAPDFQGSLRHEKDQSEDPGGRARWRRDDPDHLAVHQREADPSLSRYRS